MAVRTLIKPSTYYDSVTLMLVARELARLPGVADAAVVMGTPANKSILKESGLLEARAEAASANDLVIAVRVTDGSGEEALAQAERLLLGRREAAEAGPARPISLRAAVQSNPAANVSVISVAGRYAADEAWEALRRGLHVLLFSDNVSLEDEVALKRFAAARGLLLMGPGAGTAIVNGVALGFANAVPSGPVGIVSAAGTGLQEVSTLLARQGIGITQGLGVGGRDLSQAVGGLMMIECLKALQADPATHVILLVSKPPAPQVAARVLDQVAAGGKPTVVCLLGGDPQAVVNIPSAIPATTLQEAALLAARCADPKLPEPRGALESERRLLAPLAAKARRRLGPQQRYLRGLYSGGTLCYEAQVIWRTMLPTSVLSNAPLREQDRLPESTRSQRHTAVDLGEEEFTVGRPHPMIDNDLRLRRLKQEAADPKVAVVVLDVVLGYGAHPDPASELAPAIRQAIQAARAAGRALAIVASITGTDGDPQSLERQAEALSAAGVVLCDSNAAAARLAAMIVQPPAPAGQPGRRAPTGRR